MRVDTATSANILQSSAAISCTNNFVQQQQQQMGQQHHKHVCLPQRETFALFALFARQSSSLSSLSSLSSSCLPCRVSRVRLWTSSSCLCIRLPSNANRSFALLSHASRSVRSCDSSAKHASCLIYVRGATTTTTETTLSPCV